MLTKKYSALHSAIASLRFDAKCFNCDFDNTLYLELDHKTAKSNGGKDADFVLLCSRCNKSKGTMPVELWLNNSDALRELEYRLSLEFSEVEVFAELVRLVAIEKQFAATSKATNHKLSTSAKRASEMRAYKQSVCSQTAFL